MGDFAPRVRTPHGARCYKSRNVAHVSAAAFPGYPLPNQRGASNVAPVGNDARVSTGGCVATGGYVPTPACVIPPCPSPARTAYHDLRSWRGGGLSCLSGDSSLPCGNMLLLS
jgi:hypothetical protein